MKLLEAINEIENYIDRVLDNIDKFGEEEIYNYYNDNRDMIVKFAEEEYTPEKAAEKIIDDYNAEHKDEKYDMESLFRSGETFSSPTGADGHWATEKYFPIAFAISNNDVETLEDYYENGAPNEYWADEDSDGRIDFMDQYEREFIRDYSLISKNVDSIDISDALRFMLDTVDDFIVPPFDLYNLYACKFANKKIIKELIVNAEHWETDAWLDYFTSGNYYDNDLVREKIKKVLE